jgi:serine protease Do
MRHMKKSLIILTILLTVSVYVHAQLKDCIVLIRPELRTVTQSMFQEISNYYWKRGEQELWNIYRSLIRGGYGTGFIVTDQSGDNYIITDSRVVAHVEKINIEIRRQDNTIKTYKDCPLIYIDDELNVAVLQFPNSEKVMQQGMVLSPGLPPDETPVWSVGYAEYFGTPNWNFIQGKVEDAKVRFPQTIDPQTALLIKHSLKISPHTGGSPLLIKDDKHYTGYSVIGINIWAPAFKGTTGLALPAPYISSVLEKAKQAERNKANPEMCKMDLINTCKIFASELASKHLDIKRVRKYISYLFVDSSGLDSFYSILKINDEKKAKEWESSFLFYSPIETLRSAIYILFWNTVQSQDGKTNISFKEINLADRQAFNRISHIRTIFIIN